ncbi:hypothetical protein Q7P37_010517 [Cladosporium fusiforme]
MHANLVLRIFQARTIRTFGAIGTGNTVVAIGAIGAGTTVGAILAVGARVAFVECIAVRAVGAVGAVGAVFVVALGGHGLILVVLGGGSIGSLRGDGEMGKV